LQLAFFNFGLLGRELITIGVCGLPLPVIFGSLAF